MAQNNTFWKIIKENEIVIPTIQRDYAYGREEAENILSNLLTNIKLSLDSNNEQLHLAFVYGKLDGKQNDKLLLRNSENIKSLLQSVKEYANDLNIIVDFDTTKDVVRLSDNVKFIPIDGQQRLTTLFLLHWYLAIHLKNKNELQTILSKFQYSTRVSSKDFCQLICFIESPEADIEINSEFITNQEGYFKQWKNDPTVKNMLIVIDQINKTFKFSTEKFSNYWEQLTSTDKICFDFFDLDNFQLTDELYVKMNSRGKKLTQFENFKAWLYNQKEIEAHIKKKIDITWYDMFWKSQIGNPKDIDTAYLQWFKNLFLADYLEFLNSSINKESIDKIKEGLSDETELEENVENNIHDFFNAKAIIATLRNSNGKFLELILSSKEAKELILNNIDSYLNKLDTIITNYKDCLVLNANKDFYPNTLEQLIFTEQDNLNWWQVTFQYAIIEYLSIHPLNAKYLNNYVRVISNLIFNTAIDSPRDYLLAKNSIDKILVEFNGDILTYLIESDINNITFFNLAQKNEEKLKAAKMIDLDIGDEWRHAIIEAENHKYFYGQIGFIFSMLKESKIDEFKMLSLRFRNIFSESVLQKEDNFLFRALLTEIGKPLFIQDENIFRFPINDATRLRIRNENWRRNLLNPERIEIISELIQNSEFDSIDSTLQFLNDKIINTSANNFLYPLIKNKELLKNARKNCLCFYNEVQEQIYLLNTTSLRGYYRELFTMDWYLKNKEKFESDKIIELGIKEIQYDIEDKPGLFIKLKNSSREFNIYRNYNEKHFELFEHSVSIKSSKVIDEFIDFLKAEKI